MHVWLYNRVFNGTKSGICVFGALNLSSEVKSECIFFFFFRCCILSNVPVFPWCWCPTFCKFWRPSRWSERVWFSIFCDFCKPVIFYPDYAIFSSSSPDSDPSCNILQILRILSRRMLPVIHLEILICADFNKYLVVVSAFVSIVGHCRSHAGFMYPYLAP